MAGSYNYFDSVQLTSRTEYASRLGNRIRYLQIHHATTTSLSGLISLMQPGGRTVSANGALSNTGELVEVVPATERAFTSGVASFDRISLTVECCNTSLAPEWGISKASRTRLAKLAVAMYRSGNLGGLTREFIIGHYEVPGTYATACPGPDMHLDAIVAEANAIYNGTVTAEVVEKIEEGEIMFIGKPDGTWLIGDAFGVENIGNLKDAGVTNQQLISAARASKQAVEMTSQVDADVLQMMLRKRGAQNVATIAKGV